MPAAGRSISFAVLVIAAISTAASFSPSPAGSPYAARTAEPVSVSAELLQPIPAGATAPDFDIATTPYGWRRFSDLWRAGGIVLVIEPDEKTLAEIERETRPFAAEGGSLVMVRRQDDGSNWDALIRQNLRCTLLSDPRGHVASLFGVAGQAGPAWFVVDSTGTVRHSAAGVATERIAIEIGAYFSGSTPMADGDGVR